MEDKEATVTTESNDSAKIALFSDTQNTLGIKIGRPLDRYERKVLALSVDISWTPELNPADFQNATIGVPQDASDIDTAIAVSHHFHETTMDEINRRIQEKQGKEDSEEAVQTLLGINVIAESTYKSLTALLERLKDDTKSERRRIPTLGGIPNSFTPEWYQRIHKSG